MFCDLRPDGLGQVVCKRCGNRLGDKGLDVVVPCGREFTVEPLRSKDQGVGSALAGILKWFGIRETKVCNCRSMRLKMNLQGPDWCEENMDEILDWLKAQANRRGLPFSRYVAKAMVNRAIKKTRKRENLTGSNPERKIV